MIPLYKSEIDIPGLGDKIQANCTIAYCSKLVQVVGNEGILDTLKTLSSKASMNDVDLFYTKSILVSSNWNKNDDVFTKEEVWAAKNTPSHKRTNIEHDEKKIVGHITDVWPIDNEGKIIAEDCSLDDLPDLFHLVNGAVIYKSWADKEYKKAVAQLIEDIIDGNMYVSMECLFNNFAYAIQKDNEFFILERNKDSAFLTQHLRAYGGTGVYDGAKLGRIPRNIVFSGKGYVKKPANENSIILSSGDDIKACTFSSAKLNNIFAEKSGVINISASINKTETENNMNEEQIKALQDKLAAAEVSVNELKAKVESLTVASSNEKKTLETEVASLKTQVTELSTAKDKAEAQVAEAKAKAVAIARASKLVSNGFTQEEADKKVVLFANLTDDQFDAVASEMKKVPVATETTKSSTEDIVDEKVLDNVKVEENKDVAPVSTVDKNETLKATKSELRSAYASYFGYEKTDENKE